MKKTVKLGTITLNASNKNQPVHLKVLRQTDVSDTI